MRSLEHGDDAAPQTTGSVPPASLPLGAPAASADEARELRESEERFRTTFEQAAVGMSHVALDGRWLRVNRKLCEIFGYCWEELRTKTFQDVTHPDDLQLNLDYFSRALAGELETYTMEKRYLHKERGSFWAHLTVTLVRDASGAPSYFISLIQDISERKHAEERLREAQAELREMIEKCPAGVGLRRGERLVYVNPAWARSLGREPAELIGASALDLVHVDDRWLFSARLIAGDAREQTGPIEIRFLGKGGEPVTIELVLGPAIEFEGARAGILIATDVSERHKMQAALLLADRMAAMGTLAAGVAHEINNPLSFVIANLDFCTRELDAIAASGQTLGEAQAPRGQLPSELGELRQALSEAREGAERVRRVVRDIKTFSRAEDERRGPVDVRKVLDSAMQLVSNELRYRAGVVRSYGDVPLVEANDARLGQVFVNLLVNAAQSFSDDDPARNVIRVVTRTDAAGRAVVEVTDNGAGIAPDLVGRIFDPFFTTKPVGGGTGLGLSVTYSIVHGHGGTIDVESALDHGTTFRVSLPAGSSLPPNLEAPVVAPAPAGRHRVLVVDDEPLAVSAVRRLLGTQHDVVGIERSVEVLDHLVRGERFDLVLCDLMMPEMTGMDLYREIGRVAPEQLEAIVFMTGGAFTPRARDFLSRVTNLCLEKPVGAEELAAVLAQRIGVRPLPR